MISLKFSYSIKTGPTQGICRFVHVCGRIEVGIVMNEEINILILLYMCIHSKLNNNHDNNDNNNNNNSNDNCLTLMTI